MCGEPRPRLVCAEYFQSDAAVTARLVAIKHVFPKGQKDDYFLYDLETTKVFRGEIESKFRIYEENNSGRAGFYWRKTKTYLLFLSRNNEDVQEGDRLSTWWLEGCGNSTPIEKAQPAVRRIERIKASKHQGGVAYGVVSLGRYGETVSGIDVIAEGNGSRFRGVTNSEGKFRIFLPSGEYKLTARKGNTRFAGDVFSYEKPDHFSIADGGCAQFQFVAAELPGAVRKSP